MENQQKDNFLTVPMVVLSWDSLTVEFMGTKIPLSNATIDRNIIGYMPVYDSIVRAVEDFPDAKFIKIEKKEKSDGSNTEEATKETE